MNGEIRASKIRTIDSNGKQAGILSKEEALALAEKEGFDLVEVASEADPPVCRIMDYGRFRYEQTKREKEAKKKQHIIKIKEIKFHPNIDVHDYQIKMRHASEFLDKGYKVKVCIVFRGREILHQEKGKELLKKVLDDTVSFGGAVEASPKMMGKNLFVTIGPTKSS
ncbi:translation initiation factor IF-3 [Chlamydiota bacterium]